jgi:hypothetical protein
MATNFQCAMLVDHYCARVHVGGPVTRTGRPSSTS